MISDEIKFESVKKDELLIEKVYLKRATYKETDDFKNTFVKDVGDKYLKIIVDLTNCKFMDSSFLGSILYVAKLSNKKGGVVKVVASHPDTTALLELTGISKFIGTYNTLEEAKESFEDR